MAKAQWTIPLERIIERTKADVDTVVRKVTLDLFRKVVLRSPVDTGRFKGNWNVGYQTPNLTIGEREDKTPRGQIDGATTAVLRAALTMPVGGVTWLSNGLPYAEPLEFGHSRIQAPGGMIRVSVAEFASIVAGARP